MPLLTIEELSRHARLSPSTIHRLKNAGLIPFYQPSGKGGRLLFPADAIERTATAIAEAAGRGSNQTDRHQRLSGPRPAWMR